MADCRLLRLLKATPCRSCATPLPAGELIWWDVLAGEPACVPCHEGPKVEARVEGIAGSSAQREYERRSAKRDASMREAHPHIGGVLLKVTSEPQSTTAWSKGAHGERVVAVALDRLVSSGCVVLHDRQIPGTKANIDHLVVSRRGVTVINAKRYKGAVESRNVGGWLRADDRLFVNGHDRSKLIEGVLREAADVRRALGPELADLPLIPTLCFVGADWPMFAKPFVVGGVRVAWPKALGQIICRDGPLTPEGVNEIADTLSRRLPPA